MMLLASHAPRAYSLRSLSVFCGCVLRGMPSHIPPRLHSVRSRKFPLPPGGLCVPGNPRRTVPIVGSNDLLRAEFRGQPAGWAILPTNLVDVCSESRPSETSLPSVGRSRPGARLAGLRVVLPLAESHAEAPLARFHSGRRRVCVQRIRDAPVAASGATLRLR